MTHPGLATHVGVVQDDPYKGVVLTQVNDTFSLLDLTPIGTLFNDAREAEKESGALAEPLTDVSRQVAAQEKAVRDAVADPSAADLDPSLTLADNVSRTLLKALRRGGASLRKRLSDQCEGAFKTHNFPSDRGAEPPLTFAEQPSSPHVLWDLMYEGDTLGDVRWESFWGFRIPIAHWVLTSRTKKVSLRRSVFGGLHEELPFAAREINAVAERLRRTSHCHSVVDYFKRYVRRSLIDAKMSEADADAWLARHERDWLEEYLSAGAGAPDDADQWKQDRIVEMLRSTDSDFDLLHFACHSAPSTGLASRTELTMKVGGESLVFNVGDMMANLRIKIANVDDPGPLVFLNACRSVSTAQPFQPPPFATSWINDRAALAVVSAVCPVPDYFAHAFALKFYDFLFGDAVSEFAGLPVQGWLAGALLATRRYFMQVHGNPLGLAYILYTSPGAHLTTTNR